ncbi:MAG TPA: hypothetical protein VNO50_09195 [Pyrinomonadaceae bacterium]|nr:hypothetical protein [Pyrinomonadaceae bacterium]
MSHFLTFVLVEPEASDVEGRADELLWPYFVSDLGYRNSKSKCDGFTIGGRYDGQLYGAEPMYNLTPARFQERYGLDVVKPADNIRRASEVSRDLVPYAIVTPDGEWFDCEQKDRERWATEAGEIMDRYRDHLIVAIDCHC